MLFASFLAAVAFSGVAFGAIDFENWAPPGDGDVRGPCPALNSLANHHIIPHDGRNLTVPLLVDVLGKAFNLSPELATVIAQLGIATNDPSADFFDLPNLNKHNAFEHDASLSRVDFAFSGEENIATFDEATFRRFFDPFNGSEYIGLQAAAAARYSMVQYSREHTPGFTYESQHQITSYA
ncbi:Chloroperoxidase [Pseudomassariella vexata]|uniref:Chloroperoxidase n=1 Tax=Pseudomassariella vexata TaxID=1141098 RepID=A0A1Y2E6Q2_9PEZI|nr:Chloroperoxidase [Pseudomassariella vexata]ORY67212.1 Chloroperoxidase [Pseudomassariella vexata]